MTIRIFHISDFHLTRKSIQDWEDYQRDSFIQFVNENITAENFIVCTGDMLDKAGDDLGGIQEGLKKFKKIVIDPIIQQTQISIERFIIAPGNHDIDRKADKDYIVTGVRTEIKSGGVDKINKYVRQLLEEKGEPAKRVTAYYAFVCELYKGLSNIKTSYLGTVYNYNIKGIDISFSSFNTVWNCNDDRDREEGIAIGEPQYQNCEKAIPDNAVKIAVMHHPLDWLKYERQTIQAWIRKDYNLLLMGHIHENDTLLTMNPAGNLIINFAPSFTADFRENSKTYANGFTLIDYDIDNKRLHFSYQKYNHQNRKYELNHEYSENGEFIAQITNGMSENINLLIERCLNELQSNYVPTINSNIIPQKANAIKTLNEAFVMPPLKKNGDYDGVEDYTLDSILTARSNIVLLGQHESGKTTMLKKLLLDYIEHADVFGVVPVYYDFNVFLNQDIETIIKNFLSCNTQEVEMLIKNGKIVLLVDNYNPSEEKRDQVKRLYRFQTNNIIRIIATTNYEINDVIPDFFIENNEIAFETYFIHQFRSSNIRDLITKWSPDLQIQERNQKIEDLVNRFCSFALPCTAMSISLYLWSTENTNREPVNPAILLDIYLEIILERMSIDNIYVKTFDYDNKTGLLAYLAQSIHDEIGKNTAYTLTYGNYITKIEEYIITVGYKGIDANKLGEYFIERKIFVKHEGQIEFAHACFYYFFLAKRMVKFPKFRQSIIKKDQYFKYNRVIEYYGGLVRTDKELLSFLYEEFTNIFSEVNFIYNEVDMDKCFTNIIKGQNGYVPIIQKVTPQKIIENKPTGKETEEKVLAIADERISRIKDAFYEPKRVSPDALIWMLSRALRNLDGVEDVELKQNVYNSLVRNSLIFTVINKDYFAHYANSHNGNLPPMYSNVKNVGEFLRFMPFNLQTNLAEIIATRKLVGFFEKKFKNDLKGTTSDVEKYFSLGMMWDSTGLENKKHLKSFLRKVRNNSSQDYLFCKLLYYFNTKVALGSELEDEYIDLLVDLRVKQKLIKVFEKNTLKKQLKETRNKRIIEEKKKQ